MNTQRNSINDSQATIDRSSHVAPEAHSAPCHLNILNIVDLQSWKATQDKTAQQQQMPPMFGPVPVFHDSSEGKAQAQKQSGDVVDFFGSLRDNHLVGSYKPETIAINPTAQDVRNAMKPAELGALWDSAFKAEPKDFTLVRNEIAAAIKAAYERGGATAVRALERELDANVKAKDAGAVFVKDGDTYQIHFVQRLKEDENAPGQAKPTGVVEFSRYGRCQELCTPGAVQVKENMGNPADTDRTERWLPGLLPFKPDEQKEQVERLVNKRCPDLSEKDRKVVTEAVQHVAAGHWDDLAKMAPNGEHALSPEAAKAMKDVLAQLGVRMEIEDRSSKGPAKYGAMIFAAGFGEDDPAIRVSCAIDNIWSDDPAKHRVEAVRVGKKDEFYGSVPVNDVSTDPELIAGQTAWLKYTMQKALLRSGANPYSIYSK